MAYELFVGRRRHSTRPMVRMEKSGRITLNKACLEMYLKDVDYVLLFYDREENQIGLKPVKADQRTSSARKIFRQNSCGSISTVALIRFLGITCDQSKRYNCEWNDEEGMLEFQPDSLFREM